MLRAAGRIARVDAGPPCGLFMRFGISSLIKSVTGALAYAAPAHGRKVGLLDRGRSRGGSLRSGGPRFAPAPAPPGQSFSGRILLVSPTRSRARGLTDSCRASDPGAPLESGAAAPGD